MKLESIDVLQNVKSLFSCFDALSDAQKLPNKIG